jgi:hypothetical protein
MKAPVAIAMLAVAVSAQAGATPPSSDAPAVPAASSPALTAITKPIWVRRVTGPQLFGATPQRVYSEMTEGFVTLHCSVTAAGLLDGCTVTREQPARIGLGKIALQLVGDFQMKPVDGDGAPVAGRTVAVQFRWTVA